MDSLLPPIHYSTTRWTTLPLNADRLDPTSRRSPVSIPIPAVPIVVHEGFEPASAHVKPIPKHWKGEFPEAPECIQPLLKVVFAVLCMVAFGARNLEHKWKMVNSSEAGFTENTDRLASRVSTITVVVSYQVDSQVG